LSESPGKEKSNSKGKIKENNASYLVRFRPLEYLTYVLPNVKIERNEDLELGKSFLF
jgi:hypothetical protein